MVAADGQVRLDSCCHAGGSVPLRLFRDRSREVRERSADQAEGSGLTNLGQAGSTGRGGEGEVGGGQIGAQGSVATG